MLYAEKKLHQKYESFSWVEIHLKNWVEPNRTLRGLMIAPPHMNSIGNLHQ